MASLREPFSPHTRIAVPPGVGDVYWVLCKLHDFRRKNMIKRVTLCVKQSPLVRALDWSKMTPLVDATEEFDFAPTRELLKYGYTRQYSGVDCAMWPNAIIDRGQHLSAWMPRYQLDLDFKINTAPGDGERDYVIYASSEGVNKNWFPGRGPEFWNRLIDHVAVITQREPTLIGAGWDENFAKGITAPCKNLIAKTTLPEVAGIIERARGLVGIISGMTILGNHFRTPTVAIYPDRFMPGFLSSYIKHATPYIPVASSLVRDPRDLAQLMLSISR